MIYITQNSLILMILLLSIHIDSLHCLKWTFMSYSVSNLQIYNDTKQRIFSYFIGKYDNIAQASIDASNNKPTAALGGHEHVSTLFLPFSSYNCQNNNHNISKNISINQEIIASYKFGYDHTKTYRFRLYEFVNDGNNTHYGAIRMRIYRPKPHIESYLKSINYNPNKYYLSSIMDDFDYVENCDVLWKPYGIVSNVLARLQLLLPKRLVDRFMIYKGLLVNGQVELPSSFNPNSILIVKDDLRIKYDELWINDQVYLKSNGTRIIGNSFGIPYKFKKVFDSD